MDSMETEVTLTAEEAWKIVGTKKISRGAWFAAIARVEVPHLRIGRRILIPKHAFYQWLESAGATASIAAAIGWRARWTATGRTRCSHGCRTLRWARDAARTAPRYTRRAAIHGHR